MTCARHGQAGCVFPRPAWALAAGALLSVLCGNALAGCDQFARIGIEGAAGAPAKPAVDAGKPAVDAGKPEVDAGRDAGSSVAAGSDSGVDAGRCPKVTIAGCDPVKNKYCDANFAMQCAIDLLNPLTGYCIFGSPTSTLGGNCFNSGLTETCPPRSTCFSGLCATICLCDADCEAGKCCTERIGDTGFSVCGNC